MDKSYAIRTKNDMQDVLADPLASGPETFYHMVRGGTDRTNITIWNSGLVGDEYIKSYGHYHVGKLGETYTVLQGEGIVIFQERAIDVNGIPKDDEIVSFRALYVRPGDKVRLEPTVGHLAINVGDIWLVTSDDSPVNLEEKQGVSFPSHADYEPFRKLRGAAYYVVRGIDGKPTLKRNMNYKIVPEASIEGMTV